MSESLRVQIGDTVKYSREWLRNTGQITGDVPFMQGEVVALQTLSPQTTIATVEFNRLAAHGPKAIFSPIQRLSVNVTNLHVVGTPEPC